MYHEQSFKAFIECTPDAAVIINPGGEIVLVNSQTEQMFHYDRNELLGKKIEVLIPDRFFNSHINYRNEFLAHPKTRPMGHPGMYLLGKRKNREEFRVEISLSPVKTPTGENYVYAAIRDISVRVEMEEKLKFTEELFRRIFEHSLNGIVRLQVIFDESNIPVDFKFKIINHRAEELMMKRKEEVEGKQLSHIFPGIQHSNTFKTMLEVISTGNTYIQETKVDWISPSIWHKISFVKVDDGIICTFDDITARKEAQQKLQDVKEDLEKHVHERTERLSEANARLMGINDKLDKYAYMISHDLKAPLANIEGISTFIEEDYSDKLLDDEGREMLQMMRSKIEDMRNIIENVLQSAKEEIRSKEQVSTFEIAHQVVESLQPPSHFHVFIQARLPIVRYSRISLKQIFQNLLSNAIKYMDKSQPLITVSCNETEENFLICVTDNGPGIPREKQKEIFQLFETVNSEDCNVESHGIGLTIVKQLVEENKGKIWVESELGKETKFHFTIPKN